MNIQHGQRPIIVAELSTNHSQSLHKALRLVDAAAQSGVDAIKLQTYTPDTMTFPTHRTVATGTPWHTFSLYDLYTKGFMPWEWHKPIFQRAREHNLLAFSSPFHVSAVDFLEQLNVPAYKIASFEITDLPLIQTVAETGKTVIISTGMATVTEIDEAVQTVRTTGNDRIVLLHCTSSYPAKASESNLLTIPHMHDMFQCPVGLSDHTLGIGSAVASVALGAVCIEKHFTLSRDEPTLDSQFSLEPQEMQQLVTEVHQAWQSLGSISYGPAPSEETSVVLRRSLYVVRDIQPGDMFTERNVQSLRPADGLPPKYLPIVLGRRATHTIRAGTPLTWNIL